MRERALGLLRRPIEILETDLIEWDASRAVPEPKVRPGTEIVRLGPDSADENWRQRVPSSRHGAITWSQARADTAFLAFVDGHFAGWMWLGRNSCRYPGSGLKIRLAPDEAYSYGLWVDEQYRPYGVAAALIARLLRDAQADRGVSRVYGWVDRRNRESDIVLRMVFGFKQAQRIKRIQVLRRWGRQLPFSAHPRSGPLSLVGRHSGRP